jgi:hypothetical protein
MASLKDLSKGGLSPEMPVFSGPAVPDDLLKLIAILAKSMVVLVIFQ